MVYRNIADLKNEKPAAVALGLFDGVHLGHQAVIGEAVAAQEQGLIPAVFTFSMEGKAPSSKAGNGLLQTDSQRYAVMEALGAKMILSPPFDTFERLSSGEFVQSILVNRFSARMICCGENYRFGYKASAGVEELKAICVSLGLEVRVVGQVMLDGEPVSSTRIRACLEAGDTEVAGKLLGRPFGFSAPVIVGQRLGRTIGFPTVNQPYPERLTRLRRGVYLCELTIRGRGYVGVCNVGIKPTVGGQELLVETHILDFQGDLYGEAISIRFIRFLRPEKKFGSIEALRRHIESDIQEARHYAHEISKVSCGQL